MQLTNRQCLTWGLIPFYITAKVYAGNPVSAGVSMLTNFMGHLFGHEMCNSDWISYDETGLTKDLHQKLFGQPIASRIVLTSVTEFMKNNNPTKPLVLSFHGSSGTGKSFVSKLIADNIFRKRKDSGYVKMFMPEEHFPDPSQIQIYKSWLKQQIKDAVSSCERTMFVFDEVDKMDPRLIQTVQPFLEYYDQIDGISYQRAIFIFLSKSGEESITKITSELLESGKQRQQFSLSDYNNGGTWHATLMDKSLVDFYVPFLPLERNHVLQCATAVMTSKHQVDGDTVERCVRVIMQQVDRDTVERCVRVIMQQVDEDTVERWARDLQYFPAEEPLFVVSGCKNVANRLYFYHRGQIVEL